MGHVADDDNDFSDVKKQFSDIYDGIRVQSNLFLKEVGAGAVLHDVKRHVEDLKSDVKKQKEDLKDLARKYERRYKDDETITSMRDKVLSARIAYDQVTSTNLTKIDQLVREMYDTVYQDYLSRIDHARPEIRDQGRFVGDVVVDKVLDTVGLRRLFPPAPSTIARLQKENHQQKQISGHLLFPSTASAFSSPSLDTHQFLGRWSDGTEDWIQQQPSGVPEEANGSARNQSTDPDKPVSRSSVSGLPATAAAAAAAAANAADQQRFSELMRPWTDPVLDPVRRWVVLR